MDFRNGQFFSTEMEALKHYENENRTMFYPVAGIYTPSYQHYYVSEDKRVLSIRIFISDNSHVYAQLLRLRELKSGSYVKLPTTDKIGHQYNVSALLRDAKGLVEKCVKSGKEWRPVESEPSGLYQRYFPYIVNYIRGMFNLPKAAAEDIVQDAYIYIHMRRSLHHSEVAAAWFFYSKKRSFDYKRRKICYEVSDAGYMPVVDANSKVWDHLSGKSSVVLNLWSKGCSAQDISEIMDISRKNVESRISRGIKALREFYKSDIEIWKRGTVR